MKLSEYLLSLSNSDIEKLKSFFTYSGFNFQLHSTNKWMILFTLNELDLFYCVSLIKSSESKNYEEIVFSVYDNNNTKWWHSSTGKNTDTEALLIFNKFKLSEFIDAYKRI